MIKISIVIPCRNEAPYIDNCLSNILASEGIELWDHQIFVVDGMSDDGTREIVRDWTAKNGRIHLVDNPQQLTPYAFNLGIKAGGEVDFFQIVGARHFLSPNYLATCVRRLQESAEVDCVGGRIVNEFANETGRIIATAMGTSFGMGLGNFRTLHQSGYTDTVTSPMYRYDVLRRIGWFDERLVRNQDDDFNFRVTQAGGKIYYEHSISLRYVVRGDYRQLWRQFYQYGYWKVFVNRKHQTVTTFRQLVPPAFVLYLMLWMLSGFNFAIFQVGSLPLLVYVFLLVMVSNKNALSEKVSFFGLMKTFPLLHVSYGLGYLLGIWHFLVLKRDPDNRQSRMSR